MGEIWNHIKGFEGCYEVSNLGSIRSVTRIIAQKNGKSKKINGRILKTQHYPNGYQYVCLSVNSICRNILIHRLVAEHFVDNPFNKPEVNHKDLNKNNNVYSNLEWCTHSENHKHLYNSGKINKHFVSNEGVDNGRSLLSEEHVIEIANLLKNGQRRIEIARLFNVSKSTIDKIAIGKNWNHITNFK